MLINKATVAPIQRGSNLRNRIIDYAMNDALKYFAISTSDVLHDLECDSGIKATSVSIPLDLVRQARGTLRQHLEQKLDDSLDHARALVKELAKHG